MLLIADSGSTKTDWRLISDNNSQQNFQTIGLSPYHQTEKFITDEIKDNLYPQLKSHISNPTSQISIFYYGTGCSTPERCDIIKRSIAKIFTNSAISVKHDLLAAARAACGNQEGITAILGTGSNTCYYDGKEIKDQVINLGYILGDEGSGMHIGKLFLRAFFYKELPEHIVSKFQRETNTQKEEVFDSIYSKPMANKYLASFTKFIKQNIQEPALRDIVKECFTLFFDKHICNYPKYKTLPMNCVGSIAHHFSDILKEAAKEKGVTIGKIVTAPMDELVKFHTALS